MMWTLEEDGSAEVWLALGMRPLPHDGRRRRRGGRGEGGEGRGRKKKRGRGEREEVEWSGEEEEF